MTDFLIRLFIKNPTDISKPSVRESYGKLGSLMGIISNLLLCLLKIVVGSITNSISITADGLNNLSDMGSSVITGIGFKLAAKPADKNHPYGHGRMEYLSAFIVSVLIMFMGVELLKESATAIFSSDNPPRYTAWAYSVLIVSIAVKLFLFVFYRKLAKKIDSSALLASAQDSINDTVATLFILIGAAVCGIFDLNVNLDAILGLCVAVFILYSGVGVAKQTIGELLGNPPSPKTVSDIKDIIMSFDGFGGIHDLIVHDYGPERQFASVHVEVPQNSDIVKCHEKIDICERIILERLGIHTVIHMDPIETDDLKTSEAKATVLKILTDIDSRLTLHDFRMTPKSEQQTNFIFDVVLPSDFSLSEEELYKKITAAVKLIDKGYFCVITFDRDYTGSI